jgi:hypothetical protein
MFPSRADRHVATANKPLQRPNACAARSMVVHAATARASPAPPRGHGTLVATVRRSPLNGKSLDGRIDVREVMQPWSSEHR